MIGREADLVRLDELARGGGIVTLTGPGGVGKTRLATEFARRRGDTSGAAVTQGLLADIPARSGVSAVADSLGFESLDAATVALAERTGVVVLDNCEHVLEAARTVATALGTAATLVVATSREPLRTTGERVFVVDPLPIPAPGGADAESSAAVALFFERAAAAGAALEPSPQVLADVAELCRRLDGLPLAIELAAARTRAIAPGDLLSAVDQRLDLLKRSPTDDHRHDSMRAALELSTSLLAPDERALFRRLGVITGSFDLGVAHAVAGDAGSPRLSTLDALAGLVERSLVTAQVVGPTTRYRLLELLREHAVAELAAAGEVAAVEERFVTAMVATADGIVARALSRWDVSLLASAGDQYANLAQACELCLTRDATPERAFRLLLPMFAAVHEGRPHDVWALGQRVRDQWPRHDAPWRAEVHAVLASAAAIAGRSDDAVALAEEVVADATSGPVALALAERAWGLAARPVDSALAAWHFDRAGIAAERAGMASMVLEVAAMRAGELDLAGETDEALVVLAGVLAASDEADDAFTAVLAHLVSCRIRVRAGDIDEATADLAIAESTSSAIGQAWWTSAIIRTKACVASCGPGGWVGAVAYWREAIDLAARQGALGEVAITLRTAASVAHHLGEREAAVVLQAAVPRSSAITVLPELFPASAHALAAAGTPAPQGTNLVAALRRARAALEPPGEPPPGLERPAPGGSSGELVLEGGVWRIGYGGRTVRIRDMKGIGDVAVLVGRTNAEVHVLELVGGSDVGDAAGPLLDDTARNRYRTRIIELQQEIDAARDDHDGARAERAEVELDALVGQLSEAFGLGGRSRTTGSSTERARTTVTYRIRAAIRRIAEVHPELGRHLTNAVKTGTWCSYRPESDVEWTVDRSGLTV